MKPGPVQVGVDFFTPFVKWIPPPGSTVSVQCLGSGLWLWGQVGLQGKVMFLPVFSLFSVQDS